MVRMHSIGVFSCAKLCAVVQGAIGAVVGVIFLLLGLLGSAISSLGSKMGFVASVAAAVAITLCYGILGFIVGGIGAFFYNWAAEMMGGLELELESLVPTQAQPPNTYFTGA